HASDRRGPQKLAARGQRAGRTEGRGDCFRGRIVPPAGCAGERLPQRCLAWHEPPQTRRSRPVNASPLVPVPGLILPWVGQTLTLERSTVARTLVLSPALPTLGRDRSYQRN